VVLHRHCAEGGTSAEGSRCLPELSGCIGVMTCTMAWLPLLLGLFAHAAAFADPNPTPPTDNGRQQSLKHRQLEVERWQYKHGQLGLHTVPTNGQG
jgi:hypothetical protein